MEIHSNRYVYLLIITLCININARGQNLSAKTNQLHLDLTEDGLPNSHTVPIIQWIKPNLKHTSSLESKVHIQVKVASEQPIKSVQLHVGDDRTNKHLRSKTIETKHNQKELIIDQSLWMPNGSMYVELEVSNHHDATVSSKRSITVGKSALENMISMNRKDYALLFATDRYDNWDDLVNPIDDAYALGKMLEENYGFEVEIIENAQTDEIWEKLRTYNERAFNPQDQLMIFFAGHGHYDETFGEGYVVATNSLNNDLGRSTYVSHNRLRGIVDNIPCEHILLTMDVCFGGTLDPVLARSRGMKHTISDERVLIRKFNKRTRKYLTSGGKEYVSDGIPGGHSPFMSRLLAALGTMGGDDRILMMSEIKSNMENLALIPRFGSFGTDDELSDFVFIAR